jgi:diphthine-ammonia ligase
MKVGALTSSGKDSNFALYKVIQSGHEVVCLMTLKSKNPDSYMFQSQGVEQVELQAESLNIPLIERGTEGVKEEELEDLKAIIAKAKEDFGIEAVCTGALYSDYQRERIENICKELSLEAISPLWHLDQEEYMREIIRTGFKFIIVKVAADGLNKSWLGKEITMEDIDKLVKLNEKIGMNVAFEGGEAETLMIDGPTFNKRIVIKESTIEMENKCTGVYNIKVAELV